MKISALFLFLCLAFSSFSQNATQTLRGLVRDRDTHVPLPFVTVGIFSDSVFIKGAVSDTDGYYRIELVPIGRYNIRASFVGYILGFYRDVIINSGKECIVNIEMEEQANNLNEVVIEGTHKNETINEMSVVSARMFSTEEANRYAGSRSDPGRMASNFAGVQGSDDSRNDIVVRGNSPFGVLWRINGMDVPNPNHFAIPGTTGGSVCMINSKVVDNSDFLTGAFAAEYGNALAGVFDLKFRNGNNEKNEFTAQLGFLGTEVMAEGPVSKKDKSSYLVAYRYSTLKLFESLKIHIGTNAIPNYQDLSYKINFPSKKGGSFSFFGIGGTSKVNILVSPYDKPQEELYGDNNKDQYFGSSMGMTGVSKTSIINSSTSANLTLAYQLSNANDHDNLVNRDSLYHVTSIAPILGYAYNTGRASAKFTLSKKFSPRFTLKAGIIADNLSYNLKDTSYNSVLSQFTNRLDYKGSTWLIQSYVQGKYKLSDKLVTTFGVHEQSFLLNNSSSVEPRAGLRWAFKENQSLNAGFGMHSQMQPYYIYFQHVPDAAGDYVQPNRNLTFSRSDHYVLSYDRSLNGQARIKVETYYMHLHDIPVNVRPTSYSLVNEGSSFDILLPDSLVNKGTGRNYGLEFTLEKFFSKSYFFMFTASLFDSRYKGSDGIERSTTFNGHYAMNALGEKEFALTKNHHTILSTGFKVTREGGQHYTPVDTAASRIAGQIVEIDAQRNTLQFKDYFRLDLKIGLKINKKKITHEFAFDMVNVLNTKNLLSLTYVYDPANPTANPIQKQYQLGFLPLFYYKIDF